MNGNNMLGGIGGFMQGWRYGRELVEGDEQDRKLRAAQLASEEAAAVESRKEQGKFDREWMKQQAKNEQFRITSGQTAERDANNNANALARLGMDAGRLGLDSTRYAEGAPMREAQYAGEKLKNEEALLRTQKVQTDAQFVADSRRDLEEFGKWADGKADLDPVRATRWDTLAGIAAQDPGPSLAALQKLLPQSKDLYAAGNLQGISQLWGSPEGKVAMEAWAPAYKTAIGKTIQEGGYVIQDVNPNRLEMVDAGDKKGPVLILDVSIAPTKERMQQLETALAKTNDPAQQAHIRSLMAPSTYQAPLTEGRVPVGDGGQPRVFTQQEFAKGISNLQQRLAFHQQHPDQVDKIRRRLLARASGSGVSDALKAEAALNNTMIQEELKLQDQALRKEGFDLKKRGLDMKAAGKDGSSAELNRKFAAVDKATSLATRDTFNTDGERQSMDRELLDYHQQLNMRTKDIISSNPGMSIEEAFKQAADQTPQPQSEVDKQMADMATRMRAAPPAPAQGMSPTGNIDGMARQVIGPNGERFSVVLRNGQWVRQ